MQGCLEELCHGSDSSQKTDGFMFALMMYHLSCSVPRVSAGHLLGSKLKCIGSHDKNE